MARNLDDLAGRFSLVRALTEELCAQLEPEDYMLQGIAETSPAKWHLAHVTWFFERFVLSAAGDYKPFNEQFFHLFNSYYELAGQFFPREKRHLLSRPSIKEVYEYRHYVTSRVLDLLQTGADVDTRFIIEAGINHEEQHQELLLTDLKFNFFQNPIFPRYSPLNDVESPPCRPLAWLPIREGLYQIGAAESDGFAYDNEKARHQVFINEVGLSSRLVNNSEFMEFIDDGGYERSEFWLSDGWSKVKSGNWQTPLYWVERDGEWFEFSLSGLQPLCPSRPVCHVSFYEADAYARWRGCRLPTEMEWEAFAQKAPTAGHFLDAKIYQPRAAAHQQFFGDTWEWTQSAYLPYPGFKPFLGLLGEYNGKFMCNQMVLRGGSCVTPKNHIRPTYRNFFYPETRWQFSGIRLAKEER